MELTSNFCRLVGLFVILQVSEEKLIKTESNKEEPETHSISRREASDTLLFPEDDNPTLYKQSLRRDVVAQELNPSPCPNGAKFCESASDYPKEHVKSLIKKQPKFPLNGFFVEEEDIADVERFGEADETSLCPSMSRTVYPNKGQSRDGVLEFIVNEENYKQGIKVEQCVNEGKQCNIPGSLSLGYTSHCRQKNIVRTLVVVNKNVSDVEGFITKPFEFPSCCACMISMKSDRFGPDPTLATSPVRTSTSSSGKKG